MQTLLAKFWSDDDGALLSAEWLCLASVAVFGAAVGMSNIRDSLNSEFSSFGQGLHSLSQGYQFPTVSGSGATVNGTNVIDPVTNTVSTSSVPTPVTAIGGPAISIY